MRHLDALQDEGMKAKLAAHKEKRQIIKSPGVSTTATAGIAPIPQVVFRGSEQASRFRALALHRSILSTQRALGNRYVQRLLEREASISGAAVARQEDEAETEYPPDWQHGAPTKPVPPDPNVWPIPDNKQPETPYRTPSPPPKEEEPSTREKIAEALRKAGVPAWAVAGLVVLVIAALADPEPFTKVALLIGAAAAALFFILIGRGSDVPPDASA